jgi:signal-transduction protein with cAMP-binding, CBS, and nucleotidyltransferase domain
LINKGTVKLIAENNFPFAIYKTGEHFGLADMLSGVKRNGTAQASEDTQLYKIQKN